MWMSAECRSQSSKNAFEDRMPQSSRHPCSRERASDAAARSNATGPAGPPRLERDRQEQLPDAVFLEVHREAWPRLEATCATEQIRVVRRTPSRPS